MRRKDREVTSIQQMMDILARCPVLRLGMNDRGTPYIVPLSFGYARAGDALALYFHSAPAGRKIDVLRRDPRVCFEADCSFAPLPAENPCQWSARYESVVGDGYVTFLKAPQQRKAAMDAIMRRYGYAGAPAYDPAALAHTCLCRVDVTRITGKRHMV
nr:pyridoxamine 5'-phosphate oxidase family protein [Maliibacterium massiliense]